MVASELDQIRRREAFAARVHAKRDAEYRASLARTRAEHPTQIPVREATEPREPVAAPVRLRRLHHAVPASLLRSAVTESPREATQAHAAISLPTELRGALSDAVARAQLAEGRYWHVERAQLQHRENRLAKQSETDRLLARAGERDERSLLAMQGASSAHRVLVTDDCWDFRFRIDDNGNVRCHGSAFRLWGVAPGTEPDGPTVEIRLAQGDGSGIVPHSVFEPEREASEARETSEASEYVPTAADLLADRQAHLADMRRIAGSALGVD